MSRAASVVMFCMIGRLINAPSYYWICVVSYYILCKVDDHYNK